MAAVKSSEGMKSLEAKVVVLGSQGVGKTSVVIRYVGGMFSKAVSPTIGASFFTYKLTLDNYRVKLQVWDTAGQERFRSMAPMYYRKANAAMLLYDITNSDSFYDIQDWIKELRKNVDYPIILCLMGNKSDLESGRNVSTEEAEEYAASIGALFYEVSALKNTGIEEAFMQVAKELIKLYETNPDAGFNIVETNSNVDVFGSSEPIKLNTNPPAKKDSNCSC